MEAFLPSEIGRLIYGYLFEQCGENLAEEFLHSCDSMRECYLLKQKFAKNFHYKVQDLSLEDIFNQYSVLCSLIFKNTTDEEPVHCNVLSLLQKILTSKLGSSIRTSDCDNDMVPIAEKANNYTIVLEEQRNSTVDEGISFSPSRSDIEDDKIISAEESTEKDAPLHDTLLNTRAESIVIINETSTKTNNFALDSESRVRTMVIDSTTNKKSPKESASCTPPKPDERSKSNKSANDVTKEEMARLLNSKITRRKSNSSGANTPTKLATKTFSTNSPTLPIMTPSAISPTPKTTVSKTSCSPTLPARASSTSVTDVQMTSGSTAVSSVEVAAAIVPQVGPAEMPLTAIGANLIDVQVTSKTVVNAALPSALSAGVDATDTIIAAPVCSTAVPTIYPVHRECEISLTTSPAVPSTTTSLVVAPPLPSTTVSSVENVFGDLSLGSECSVPSKPNESASSVKSPQDSTDKEKPSELVGKGSPKMADSRVSEETVVSACQATPKISEEFIQSAPKSTPNEFESSTASPALLEAAKANSSEEELPWDEKLRRFVRYDSLVDCNVTKRKPKDLRSRKRKETPKKRKHNDSSTDVTSNAKRFKPDAVPAVAAATPRPKSVAAQLVEASDDAVFKSTKSQRRYLVEDDDTAIDCDEKTKKHKKSKNRSEQKIIPDGVSIGKRLTSMTDIVDFDDPPVETTKKGRVEKEAIVENKKQQVTGAKKLTSTEIQNRVNALIIKPAASVDNKHELSHHSMDKKRSRRKEEPVIEKKKRDIVNHKNNAFKEPVQPYAKDRNISSSKEAPSSRTCHGELAKSNKTVNSKANEIKVDHCKVSINEKKDEIDDGQSDDDIEYELELEVSPEFVLYYRISHC